VHGNAVSLWANR